MIKLFPCRLLSIFIVCLTVQETYTPIEMGMDGD